MDPWVNQATSDSHSHTHLTHILSTISTISTLFKSHWKLDSKIRLPSDVWPFAGHSCHCNNREFYSLETQVLCMNGRLYFSQSALCLLFTKLPTLQPTLQSQPINCTIKVTNGHTIRLLQLSSSAALASELVCNKISRSNGQSDQLCRTVSLECFTWFCPVE